MQPEPANTLPIDEVRIIDVDDGDPSVVNELLREGWQLLSCGVAEFRQVRFDGTATSDSRCTFILGRSRGGHVLDEAAAVVEATAGSEELIVVVPTLEELTAVPSRS